MPEKCRHNCDENNRIRDMEGVVWPCPVCNNSRLKEGQKYLINDGPNAGRNIVVIQKLDKDFWSWKFEDESDIGMTLEETKFIQNLEHRRAILLDFKGTISRLSLVE